MILADENKCDPQALIVNGGFLLRIHWLEIDANAVKTASLIGIAQCSIRLTHAHSIDGSAIIARSSRRCAVVAARSFTQLVRASPLRNASIQCEALEDHPTAT